MNVNRHHRVSFLLQERTITMTRINEIKITIGNKTQSLKTWNYELNHKENDTGQKGEIAYGKK